MPRTVSFPDTVIVCMQLPPVAFSGTTRKGPLSERSTDLCSDEMTICARARGCVQRAYSCCCCNGSRERLAQTKPWLVTATIECISGRRRHLAGRGRVGRDRAAHGMASVHGRLSVHQGCMRASSLACRAAVRMHASQRLMSRVSAQILPSGVCISNSFTRPRYSLSTTSSWLGEQANTHPQVKCPFHICS